MFTISPVTRRGLVVPTLTALLVGSLAGAVGLAGEASASDVTPTRFTPYAGELMSVTAVSADSAWAVGYQTDGDDVFLDHWDGAKWSPQQHPEADTSAAFLGVSASSGSDVWAVGSHYIGPKGGHDSGTYVQHYDGAEWKVVKAPNPGSNISVMSAVDARTSDDAWAVGFQTDSASYPGSPLIEHWDGTRWKAMRAPDIGAGCYGGLTGVTAITATDVWAVGTKSCDDYSLTLIDHWNGHTWTTVAGPNPGGKTFNLLNTVSALSSDDVWAVGAYNDKGATAALALHWNGHTWKAVNTPDGTKGSCSSPGSALIGVSASKGTLWAVGGSFCDSSVAGLVLRWNGRVWKVSPSPSPHQTDPPFAELRAVAAVSANAAFAVGTTDLRSGGSGGYIQSWDGHTWELS